VLHLTLMAAIERIRRPARVRRTAPATAAAPLCFGGA
jgi:hypothetical protein